MGSLLLETDNLTKVFRSPGGGGLQVLHDLQLSVSLGERIAIVGKSGTGKSTLLHLLGTLEAPTSGHVRFLGEEIFSYSEAKLSDFRNRQLGFVFQFHYLMLEFTALENVMMPALIAGKSRRESKRLALELLEKVGLKDRVHHKPGQLSGGEQQRVAIARALVMRPKLLLTDEMTGNLDPATGQQIFELISLIHAEFQMALVSVTHDEALARSYGRVLRLANGQLLPER